MSNKEINEAIHRFRGVKEFNGNLNSLSAVTYFFLMDASYQVFTDKIRPIPHKQLAKKIVGGISDSYNLFFERFFAAFNADEKDYLIDKADEMEQALEHHIYIARIALMEIYNERPLPEQEQIADIWVANKLAYEGMCAYSETWKKDGFTFWGKIYTKGDRDKQMEAVVKGTFNLSKMLFGGESEIVEEKKLQRIKLAMTILTNKIREWVVGDFKKQKGND